MATDQTHKIFYNMNEALSRIGSSSLLHLSSVSAIKLIPSYRKSSPSSDRIQLFRSQGGQYSYYSVQRFPLPRLSSKLRNTTTERCQMIDTQLGPGVTWGRHWFQSKDSSSVSTPLYSIKKKYKFLAREPYVIYSFFQSSFP